MGASGEGLWEQVGREYGSEWGGSMGVSGEGLWERMGRDYGSEWGGSMGAMHFHYDCRITVRALHLGHTSIFH